MKEKMTIEDPDARIRKAAETREDREAIDAIKKLYGPLMEADSRKAYREFAVVFLIYFLY